jgi:hypothetical protein
MVVLRGLRWIVQRCLCAVVRPACCCVWSLIEHHLAGQGEREAAEGPVVLWLTVSSSACMARLRSDCLIVIGWLAHDWQAVACRWPPHHTPGGV